MPLITQGNTWDELRHNVREAVEAFHFDTVRPATIRLHLVRDEAMALAPEGLAAPRSRQ